MELANKYGKGYSNTLCRKVQRVTVVLKEEFSA